MILVCRFFIYCKDIVTRLRSNFTNAFGLKFFCTFTQNSNILLVFLASKSIDLNVFFIYVSTFFMYFTSRYRIISNYYPSQISPFSPLFERMRYVTLSYCLAWVESLLSRVSQRRIRFNVIQTSNGVCWRLNDDMC